MIAAKRIHLDTDLGSDTDDLCALALLLGWEGAEIVGITTTTDPGGIRAGWVEWALRLAGRADIAFTAGAEGSLGGLFVPLDFPDYWPEPIEPRPSPPGEAIELLCENASSGATIVAVGPYTNLALVEAARPGLLADTEVVVMGGHVTTPPDGFPQWGADEDFNVQQDRVAAAVVFERCHPTVVPLAATGQVFLRSEHLDRLRSAGPLGVLLADQARMHARDHGTGEIARSFPRLPNDLLNWQHDSLACVVALGWDGATTESVPTHLQLNEDRLRMTARPGSPPLEVVTEVDGPGFEDAWLSAVELASAPQSQR